MQLGVHLVNFTLPGGPASIGRPCPLSAEPPTKRGWRPPVPAMSLARREDRSRERMGLI